MKLERVELMRGYRFGPKTNGVTDFTRFQVGERGVDSIMRDELGWIWIHGCGEILVVPPQHVDFCRPAEGYGAEQAAAGSSEREGRDRSFGPTISDTPGDRMKRAWETRRANAKAKE